MAKVALKLDEIKDSALGDFSQNIITNMTAEAATFPAPSPPLATLQTATTAYITAYQAALDGGITAVSLKDSRRKTLEELLTQEAFYVDNVANGNKDTILKSGMPASKDREATPSPAAPENVKVSATGNDGEVRVSWKAVKNKLSYRIESSADNITWVDRGIVSKSPAIIGGLPSGSLQWFRVFTNGTKNRISPPSDPAKVRVG